MEHFVFSRGAGLARLLQSSLVGDKRENHLCLHSGPCVQNAFTGGLRGLAAGYSITVTVTLFRVLSSRRRRKNLGHEAKKLLSDTHTARFLGSLVFSLKASSCLLRWLRGADHATNAIIAGAIAGVSYVQLPVRGVRVDITLYLMSRAVDVLLHSAANARPAANNFPPFVSVLVFMMLQAVIMQTLTLEPHNLRPAYSNWILLVAGKGAREYVDAMSAVVRHNEQHTIPVRETEEPCNASLLTSFRESFSAVEALLGYKPKQLVPQNDIAATQVQNHQACPPVVHTHEKQKIICREHHASCVVRSFTFGLNAFTEAFKMYLPLFTIPRVVGLLMSPRARSSLTLFKFLEKLVVSPVKGAARSALFIGTYTSIMFTSLCILRRFMPYENRLMHVISGALTGLSILIEKPNRRAELNIFCFARVIETLYNVLAEHIFHSPNKYVDVPILHELGFIGSCSVLFWALQHRPEMVRSSFKGVLSQLIGGVN